MRKPMDVFFAPHNVAVIGASDAEQSVGRAIMENLLANSLGGSIYPVNTKRSHIHGIPAVANIQSLSGKVDLAVIATPAETIPEIIKDCADAGVEGAIIISAGFKECGPHGTELEHRILKESQRTGMRIIGPNCLGVMNPISGLNATFAAGRALAGNVAFISQSGALCTAILDWSIRELVGFSAFMSLGSMLDVGWGDVIEYLGSDPHTKSILIYMESIGNATAFLSAAQKVSPNKPIILIKAGRSEEATKAAVSHTGSLTGSDEVLDAAFRRCGVLRVNTISDLFHVAEVLGHQPRPNGRRLTIVTNAGGPGILATDALIAGGGTLAELSPKSMMKLDEALPSNWSRSNPIDILGDAPPERFTQTLNIIADDPSSDGLLVILTPQAMTDPTRTAEQIKGHAQLSDRPILASWMGGESVAAGIDILNRAGIPTFAYPDTAASIFNYSWQHHDNLQTLAEAPDATENRRDRYSRVQLIIVGALNSGRTFLTEYESKLIIAEYGIPTVRTEFAAAAKEAVQWAEAIGYPVALKLNSMTITHKTDVGGVCLNLGSPDEVRAAFDAIELSIAERAGPQHFQGVTVQPMVKSGGYEIIIGSSIDAQFGPVLMFGSGGELVEVYRDQALALPPLNRSLARKLMEQTHIFKALQGVRGRPPVDLNALEDLLVRFSQIVIEQPRIKEIDINPLIVSSERLLALDARIVIHGADVLDAELPRSAIVPTL